MAVTALVISIVSLLVSVLTARYNRRSADAAEASEISSDRSADAAKDAAESARRVADAEVGRDHVMYEPQLNGQYVLEDGTLSYEFQLLRRYAMATRTSARAGAVVNDGVPAQRADGAWRIFIDTWSRNQAATGWETLTIRFWPPQTQEGYPEPWTCPCGRDPEPSDRPGHWQWDVRVPLTSDQVLERRTAQS